ncbi:putative Ras-related protein Rab-24 [Paratrimastix pyriformis]|uniref:Ras-related protein Rab-24 n=1 Tax=Paratrimastix pyriformis TaxID=342808 RepID=A0ABQ8U8H4_9EUKA|nr:putative Ras-related protein Rab-24 [Paratrimastix pyriformis]
MPDIAPLQPRHSRFSSQRPPFPSCLPPSDCCVTSTAMAQPKTVELKIVLLGKSSTGKTCLINRFLKSSFEHNTRTTLGAAFGQRDLVIDDTTVAMGVWDTAGQERYESISRLYYRNAGAAIICYDMTDASSFARAKFWVNELLASEKNCLIFLAGTKQDLITQESYPCAVPLRDAKKYAETVNATVFETSSKTGHNVEELFQAIAHAYVEQQRHDITGGGGAGIRPDLLPPPGPKPCC